MDKMLPVARLDSGHTSAQETVGDDEFIEVNKSQFCFSLSARAWADLLMQILANIMVWLSPSLSPICCDVNSHNSFDRIYHRHVNLVESVASV